MVSCKQFSQKLAACFSCEPMKKCAIIKDIFPDPRNFKKKIQDFSGGMGTLYNPPPEFRPLSADGGGEGEGKGLGWKKGRKRKASGREREEG